MSKKIKLEEAFELTKQEGSECIDTEVVISGYFDTWIVNYLDGKYKFKIYIDKYNSWNMLNPPMIEMTKVKLFEKPVIVKEWIECE